MTLSRSITHAGVLALALGCATVSNADSGRETPVNASVTVSFAELDLSKPAGLDVLYERLQEAAETVCGHRERRSYTSLGRTRQLERVACYDEALTSAVQQLDLTPLTELHARGY